MFVFFPSHHVTLIPAPRLSASLGVAPIYLFVYHGGLSPRARPHVGEPKRECGIASTFTKLITTCQAKGYKNHSTCVESGGEKYHDVQHER